LNPLSPTNRLPGRRARLPPETRRLTDGNAGDRRGWGGSDGTSPENSIDAPRTSRAKKTWWRDTGYNKGAPQQIDLRPWRFDKLPEDSRLRSGALHTYQGAGFWFEGTADLDNTSCEKQFRISSILECSGEGDAVAMKSLLFRWASENGLRGGTSPPSWHAASQLHSRGLGATKSLAPHKMRWRKGRGQAAAEAGVGREGKSSLGCVAGMEAKRLVGYVDGPP